jgi:hypothetical protein
MKNLFKLLYPCMVFLFLVTTVMVSCKKVEQRNAFVSGIISISGAFKTAYSIGDTMKITGRLSAANANFNVKIGDVNAVILSKSTSPYHNNYTNEKTTVDIVKLIITEEMGLGDQIKVVISSGGQVLNTPLISIRRYAVPSGQTDTTLFVNKTFEWEPSNPEDYVLNDSRLPYILGTCVTLNGHLYFHNYHGIFKVEDNVVQQLLKKGDQFNDGVNTFSITGFIGSVTDPEERYLYFSAEIADPTIDNSAFYAYRLCKMDLATKKIQTINTSTIAIEQSGDPIIESPYQGPAAQVKMVATNLKMDAVGNLFFLNFFYIYPDNYTDLWHESLHKSLNSRNAYLGENVLRNICRLKPDGQIQSLIKYKNGNGTPPGYEAKNTFDYLVSPNGKFIYFPGDESGKFLLKYDLIDDGPVENTADLSTNYRFFSYDDDPQTKVSVNPFQRDGFEFYVWSYLQSDYNRRIIALVAPDESIITEAVYSLVMVNIPQHTFYLYAGTEKGIQGLQVPSQQNLVGKSKVVMFAPIHFNGMDRNGVVYYMKANSPQSKVSFYKLYSKK